MNEDNWQANPIICASYNLIFKLIEFISERNCFYCILIFLTVKNNIPDIIFYVILNLIFFLDKSNINYFILNIYMVLNMIPEIFDSADKGLNIVNHREIKTKILASIKDSKKFIIEKCINFMILGSVFDTKTIHQNLNLKMKPGSTGHDIVYLISETISYIFKVNYYSYRYWKIPNFHG